MTPEPVVLSFAQAARDEPFALDLSAAVQVGTDLWLGTDEGTRLACLSPDGQGGYGDCIEHRLDELLSLPDDEDQEIDVEGLALDGEDLWLVGSHSRRRGDADDEASDKRRLRRLSRIKKAGNRYLLARVPLVRQARSSRLVPAGRAEGGRTAARLVGGRRRNLLTDALGSDPHLGRFLRIPGKDNGFNIEGLAATDGRLLLGLRGPVLEGWAVILLIAPQPDPDDDKSLLLGPVGGAKRTYRKVFLDLQGLGIRDIHLDGDDLLILAGPTMSLRSDAVVVRWPGAARQVEDALISRDRLEHVLDLPYGSGSAESVDHPEGIALIGEGGDRSLLVVYDSPSARRRRAPHGVVADRFRLAR